LELKQFGQSVWLDFLSRKLIRSGQLNSLIDNNGLTGVTSNPSIFSKAIGQTLISRLPRERRGRARSPSRLRSEPGRATWPL